MTWFAGLGPVEGVRVLPEFRLNYGLSRREWV